MPRSERLPAHRFLSHLVVMAAVSVVLGVVVAGLAIPFAGLAGVGTQNLADTMKDLPKELDTEPLRERSVILDTDGDVLATIYEDGGNRVVIPLRQVSRIMTKAIVSIEDYRFYEHGPLDLKGTFRALITNQANDGVVQGGSSITQQLVKLTLQQQAAGNDEEVAAAADDTYARKFNELRYASALEDKYSKDWILERYLNTAYFGDGVYGIQMAAKHYFGVNASKLKAKQAAMLAGMVKNPTKYDPTNSEDAALERRNVVLDRMAELNVISREKAEKLKEQDLGLQVQKSQNGCVSTAAPFFCDFVLDWLSKDSRLGATPEERMHLLQTGGLSIQTTVDVGMQAVADNAVRAHVYQRDQAIGALAVVEPGTGNIKAIAQSRPMGRNKRAGQTYINYVVPQKFGDSQCCQAGSTFKVFTLAAALEQGIALNTVFDSPSPKTFDASEFSTCPGSPPFGGSFETPNSTSSGRMNLYSGTRLSVNTFYMQLERETGVCKPYEVAQAMGVDLTNPNGDRNANGAELIPYFTLGVASASPLEMAEAYATFAARGLHCNSRPVTAILDARQNVIREYPSTCSQVMEQTTADAVSDVLRGVIEGGFASAQTLDQPAAGKTGTTNEGKSVWFVGYTPQLAAAAMIGGANQDGVPIPLAGQTIGGSYIYTASGSGFAAPIWGDAMKIYDDATPYVNFVYPSTVEGAGETTAAPPPCKKKCGNGGRGNGGGNGGGGGGR